MFVKEYQIILVLLSHKDSIKEIKVMKLDWSHTVLNIKDREKILNFILIL